MTNMETDKDSASEATDKLIAAFTIFGVPSTFVAVMLPITY
jgi:hypothetical protein